MPLPRALVSIEVAFWDLRAGHMIAGVDDEDREDEGDQMMRRN